MWRAAWHEAAEPIVSSGDVNKMAFLPRLESVRGIAAVTVLGYHVAALYRDLTASGMVAVVVFFVLSGFVLAQSLERNPTPTAFFRSRFFRLFPPAAAAVLLLTFLHWRFAFFVGYEASFDPLNVALNALMVRSDINGVMWSLTVECAAAPLILGSFWILRAFGTGPLAVLVGILICLSFWGPYVHLLGGFTNLAPFYAFIVGLIASARGERIFRNLTPRAEVIASLVAFALLIFCGSKKQTAPIILLEAAGATTLIALIAYGRSVGMMFGWLDHALVRFVGRISYSFYLLHPIGIALAFGLMRPWLDSSPTATTFVLAIVLTTPMAWVSWRLVEIPAIRVGKTFAVAKIASVLQFAVKRHLAPKIRSGYRHLDPCSYMEAQVKFRGETQSGSLSRTKTVDRPGPSGPSG